MQSMISLLYLLFFLGIVITGLFVVYHISKYSFSKESAFWGNAVFLIVFLILLTINTLLFLRIDWTTATMLPHSQQTSIW